MSASQLQVFDDLVQEANCFPLEGWNFSFLDGRTVGDTLPWNYLQMASDLVSRSHRTLDIDTGGGEIFASLQPQRGSVAVEPYKPNFVLSTQRLQALGVEVKERTSELLPVDDSSFDLVLNRHGYLNPREFHRVLTPGGVLLTQQVGGLNDIEFNEVLGIPVSVSVNTPASAQDLGNSLS